MQVTPDGAWLAFTADARGDEAYTVYVQQVDTGARSVVTLPDVPAATSLAWAADNRTLFFLTQVRPPSHGHGVAQAAGALRKLAWLLNQLLLVSLQHSKAAGNTMQILLMLACKPVLMWS